MAEDMPARGEDDDSAQSEVERASRSVHSHVAEEQRAQNHPRQAARHHPAQHLPIHLLAHNLHRNHDQLHHGRVRQRGADRNFHRNLEEQDQQGSRDGARAHAGQRNDHGDEKPNDEIHKPTSFWPFKS